MKHLKYFRVNEEYIHMSYSDVIAITIDLKKLEDNDFYEKCYNFNEYSDDDAGFRNYNYIREKINKLFKTDAIMYPTDLMGGLFFKIGIYPNNISVHIYPRNDEWFYVNLSWDEKIGNGTTGEYVCFKCDQEDGLIKFLNDLGSILDKYNI